MLEEKLLETLARYRQINKYAKKMIVEQEAPAPAPAPSPADAPIGEPTVDAGGAPIGGLDPAVEAGMDDATTDAPPVEPGVDVGGEDTMEDTEEIDITDLVNMTKSIKKDMEEKGDSSDAVLGKMDDIFRKLDDLEGKIGEMDQIINKIDQLGYKVEKMKEPTPEEKLQLRSLDSYPFNKTTDEFFNEKFPEMQKTGKNEYVITPDDVEEYSPDTIKKTFNQDNDEEDNFSFGNR